MGAIKNGKRKFEREIRSLVENIIEERDSGKCDICRSSKKLKLHRHFNLR